MILPIPTVVSQILFLIVSVAIEAQIFVRRGRMGHRRSIEYALAMELLVLCLGWTFFFIALDLIPLDTRLAIVQLILLGVWSEPLNAWTFLALLLSFFVALELKTLSVQVLDFWLAESTTTAAPVGDLVDGSSRLIAKFTVIPVQTFVRRYRQVKSTITRDVVLIAHLLASALCLGLLGLQSLMFYWPQS
ncbi:MAG: hypothetical protein MH825_15635 [Cyanobacteria bacterium]|nr:hypothetical protein [Cyanobacteriota bacterium]